MLIMTPRVLSARLFSVIETPDHDITKTIFRSIAVHLHGSQKIIPLSFEQLTDRVEYCKTPKGSKNILTI